MSKCQNVKCQNVKVSNVKMSKCQMSKCQSVKCHVVFLWICVRVFFIYIYKFGGAFSNETIAKQVRNYNVDAALAAVASGAPIDDSETGDLQNMLRHPLGARCAHVSGEAEGSRAMR